jgi:hypothetical protein
MATIGATLPTLQDIASRTKPGGGIDEIVEILMQENALLTDMVWQEGNLPTGHLFTSRKALPSATWRRFNQGVAPQKSRTDQIVETCGMISAMSKIDTDLAKLNGNEAAFRASEDRAFVQGLSNDLEAAYFYASLASTPEQIQGLAARLASTTGKYGGQIVLPDIATSGSDQSSMWLVVWGPDTVFGIYPKGSPMGLQMEDLGKQLTLDSGGTNEFVAYVSRWNWTCGLCVKDYRGLVRLPNIDTSAISETGSLLLQAMTKMVAQGKRQFKKGRPAIYNNLTVSTYLDLQALDSVRNSTLKIEDVGGTPVTKFLGVPVRITDAITNAEDIIS